MFAGHALVVQEHRLAVEVGDDYIHVAVIVEVGDCESAAHARDLQRRPGLGLGVAEVAVALVHEQVLGLTIARARRQLVYLRIDLAVHGNQVEPAIVVEIDERRAPLHPRQRSHGDSRIVRNVAEIVAALVEIEDVVLVGKVRDVERRQAGVFVVAERDAHRALLGAVGAHGRARLETDVGELAVAVVAIEILRRRVVGDVDVGAALVVEVGPQYAQAVVAARIVNAGGLGNIGEGAVAVVVIERVARAAQSARSALHVDAAILAGRAAAELRQIGQSGNRRSG